MELFHTLNRGVDKRTIFMDDRDRFRFIHDLFEFNDLNWVNNSTYFFRRSKDTESKDIASPYNPEKKRKLLVDIHAFCLMNNHYHLLLSPRIESGISIFMKKLNMGYAKYFNERYRRSGALFQGRYKSVPITSQAHFIHMPYYIHLNPLDFSAPEWRERKLKNPSKAIAYLDNYRWSSHLDYSGKTNFPSITRREFLTEYFGGPKNYSEAIKKWLWELDLDDIKKLTLE